MNPLPESPAGSKGLFEGLNIERIEIESLLEGMPCLSEAIRV